MTAAAKLTYLLTQTLFLLLFHRPSTRRPRGQERKSTFLTNQWPNDTVTDALNRMRQVIRTPTPDWGPDVLVKICRDMDVAFFNCILRFRVRVSWEDSASMQSARFPDPDFANRLGSTQFDRANNNCYILCRTSSSISGAVTSNLMPSTAPFLRTCNNAYVSRSRISLERVKESLPLRRLGIITL